MDIEEKIIEDLKLVKVNHDLKWYQKAMAEIYLFLGNLFRADIHKCPYCGTLNVSIVGGIAAFGYHFFTKCRNCESIYDWREII